MKRSLLAATAMLLVSTIAASAFTLVCGAPVVAYGDDKPDSNPVIGIAVAYNPDTRGWGIVYKFRDGSTVSRNNQYALRDASVDGYKVQWKGTWYRRPSIWMIGEVRRVGNEMTYYEWQYNSENDNQLQMHHAARCQPYSPLPQPTTQNDAPTQPFAQAPATQPYAQGPAAGSPEKIVQKPVETTVETDKPTAAPTVAKRDTVPIIVAGDGMSTKVDVLIGGMPLRMLIDTGATHSQVPESFASMLLRNGSAVLEGTAPVHYANGSTGTEAVLRVRELRIGSHVVRDVQVTVSSGPPLIAFPIINSIAPFTIDTRAGELIFHTNG